MGGILLEMGKNWLRRATTYLDNSMTLLADIQSLDNRYFDDDDDDGDGGINKM